MLPSTTPNNTNFDAQNPAIPLLLIFRKQESTLIVETFAVDLSKLVLP